MRSATAPRSKLPDVGTTIFTVIGQLAAQHDALNLSQGAPNFAPDPALVEGVALFGAVIGLCFWTSLALDYLVEWPRFVRLLLLVTMLGLAGWTLFHSLIGRLLKDLRDRALALVLEPHVLLLDEPTAGMGPEERWAMIDTAISAGVLLPM